MRNLVIEERCIILINRIMSLEDYLTLCEKQKEFHQTLQMSEEIRKVKEQIEEYRNEYSILKEKLKA